MNRHFLSKHQRGVVLLYGLIAMAIMLIGAVAMVRSMNTSLVNAGNLGFKRDLTNQGERAAATVMALMNTGVLSTELSRQNGSLARNYSATLLAANAQGLPNALLSDATFGTVATASNDITVADMGVTVRYVVDRMCASTGVADTDHCTMAANVLPSGTSSSADGNAIEFANQSGVTGAVPQQVVYRLSIRVDGPRQTQAFFQTTFTL